MPSPFPGMDPYLEEPSLGPDFHMTMLVAMRAALNPRLPPRYAAQLDRYVWLEDSTEDQTRGGAPDLYVAELETVPDSTSVATLAAPATVVLPAVLRLGTRYMRIVDRVNRRVVTVIELLSPANKGSDREAYLAKRRELIATRTNLVEIDLLRSGQRPMPESASDYRVLVSRPSDFPNAGAWEFSVRDPLPTITIPLDPDVATVPLDLKPCFDRTYDEARYPTQVDYTAPPRPWLRDADAAWAAALLSSRTEQGATS
jgi:hypothetical protein